VSLAIAVAVALLRFWGRPLTLEALGLDDFFIIFSVVCQTEQHVIAKIGADSSIQRYSPSPYLPQTLLVSDHLSAP
jgi:hypothetical protein